MKSQIKPLSLLASTIALSLSFASALPAFSQSTEKPSAPAEQPNEQNRMLRHRNLLNLTSDQQAQMEQIHQNTRSQIDNILTAEQKAQLESARENRGMARPEGHREMRSPGFNALNLTDDQRSQIESVRNAAKEQMDAILTPEQRQQMEQHRQEHQERRQARPDSQVSPQGAQDQ